MGQGRCAATVRLARDAPSQQHPHRGPCAAAQPSLAALVAPPPALNRFFSRRQLHAKLSFMARQVADFKAEEGRDATALPPHLPPAGGGAQVDKNELYFFARVRQVAA